ncbi:MAG: signal peptidase [Clostridia bacterium]|jgi:signal peptidase I|nr:signal peptidase [Clostridia bacterium]
MKRLRVITDLISTIFIALFIALFLNIFIIQPSTVFGSSMEPTLHDGDFVIMSKILNTFDIEPNYSDIVIIDSRIERKHTLMDDLILSFQYNKISTLFFKQVPDDRYWIKRVIGKSGDIIEFKDGNVYRNGRLLKEHYIKEKMKHTHNQKIFVPEKHIFVLGDNRNNSADSRIIGSIPIENIIGKLILTF